MTRRTPWVAFLAALLLSACGVGLPDHGPVRESSATGSRTRENAVNINPRGPGAGDSPEEVVRGFLEAMTATPAYRTSVAREFLTAEARQDWAPAGLITYATPTLSTPGAADRVVMSLEDADQTDARGGWLGPLTGSAATFSIGLERQDDEWRISEPPSHFLVPRSWFEQRLRQVSLYFFDSSGTLLVPEPVFVPSGPQVASTMVNALLQGPGAELGELTFLPADLRPVVSVPVDADGLATVALISDTTDLLLAPPEAERLVAQLAWTLRQDPAIRSFRVSIGDRPVKLANGDGVFNVEYGSAYAPYVADASPVLYGVRSGRLVAGSPGGPGGLEDVAGPFGQADYGLRSVALDMRADRAAGVTALGDTLLVGSVDDPAQTPVPLVSGVDLLEPAFDYTGRMWVVDRRPEGALVEYTRGAGTRTLDVPGISGADVKGLLVSRDGSRLVAVVRRGAKDDRILVSRVVTNGEGQVQRALPARDVTPPSYVGAVRDVAWRSPTGLVFVEPVSRGLSHVRNATVDGAALGVDLPFVTVYDDVLGLVGTPTPDQPVYVFKPEALQDLGGSPDRLLRVDKDVTQLTYVG